MTQKSLKQIVTAAMLTFVATAAYSQENTVTAKIPFAFRATGSDMPAGNYTIRRISFNTKTMELRNVDSGKSIFVHSPNAALTESTGRTRLVFECSSDSGCSLAKLWSGSGTGLGFRVPPPAAAQKERIETVFFDPAQNK